MNSENMCPAAQRAAAREVRRLLAKPPPGITPLCSDELGDVDALLEGPENTPYAGGVFRVRLVLGREFPAAPPRAYFLTRVFHPNVSRAGAVCVDTLARGWRPELGLAHALTAVRCLLIAPNADSALDADAAALLQADYHAYCRRAQLYTEIHARRRDDDAAGSQSVPEDHAVPGGSAEAGAERAGDAGRAGGAADAGRAGNAADAGPCAKRDRRERAPSAAARDKRRILKRL